MFLKLFNTLKSTADEILHLYFKQIDNFSVTEEWLAISYSIESYSSSLFIKKMSTSFT